MNIKPQATEGYLKTYFNINSPGSSRPACRNTAPWVEVCSVQTCPTAPQPPLSHWWSCPWDGRARHAAYQTAGQTRALRNKDTKIPGGIWQCQAVSAHYARTEFLQNIIRTLASMLGSTATTSERHFMAFVLTAMALSPRTRRIWKRKVKYLNAAICFQSILIKFFNLLRHI